METPSDMHRYIEEQRREGKTVGYVPTMGFLHAGHFSLFERAVKENDCAVASVFVNPTQFGDEKDFLTYPQDRERDLQFAEQAGIAAVFCPSREAMYPNGTDVTVKVASKTDVLCGKSRPGHFDGVATVLTKLFTIIQPQRVYFGMKDAQQVAIVADLIRAFHFPIELVACPIIRESDGLAKSSRNVHLSAAERVEAAYLHRALEQALEEVKRGCRSDQAVVTLIQNDLLNHLKLGKIDYVDALSYPALRRAKDGQLNGRFILALAVYYKNARLIDNVTGEI
ncbi:MAG: pantoate--beta-alanine ligase [Sporolactobacillus sp.]